MDIMLWVLVAIFLLAVYFAVDRQLWIKEIKTDLDTFLGNALIARDLAPKELRVHYQAHVSAIKVLIRKHFTL